MKVHIRLGGSVSETVWRATIIGEPVTSHEAGEAAVVQGLLRVVKSDAARLWVARAVTQLSGRRPVRPPSRARPRGSSRSR